MRSSSSRLVARALGAVAFLTVSSPADARIVTYTSMGLGKSSCQEYLDVSKGSEPDHFRYMYKDARKYVTVNNAYDQWLFGAVSAINFASGDSGMHPNIKPSTVEVTTWVRTWCGTHPDDTVATAALTYLKEKWKVGATETPPQPGAPAQASTPQSAAPYVALAAPQTGSAQSVAPQFVFVIFQKDVAAADLASFLKTYRVAIDDGPNPDGYYKLRLAEPLPADQIEAMLGSMRGQRIVSTAVTN